MAEEGLAVVATTEVKEETRIPTTADLKRKLDVLEPKQEEEEADDKSSLPVDLPREESNLNSVQKSVADAKKPRLEKEFDGPAPANGHEMKKTDVLEVENIEIMTSVNAEVEIVQNFESGNTESENTHIISASDVEADDVKHMTVDNTLVEKADNQTAEIPPECDASESSDKTMKTDDIQYPSGDLHQPVPEIQSMSRKMEVPNNKVGVLIGKSGDTIRFLQLKSGAKIQITRDNQADPYGTTRPVELIGSLENINKAETLIKDVIAEADAGGSSSLEAKGFGTVQASGAVDQINFQVPNEKVGLIIGKGGETIKNLQARSGTRIQLIPQHLPVGDQSKERTVRVTGDKTQIELARNMINEVMTQIVRPSPLSGGSNQRGQPRGQWGGGGRGSPAQGRGSYDNKQQSGRGVYPSQNPQYMPPAYGGYPAPQQSDPRSNFNGPPRGGYAHGLDYGQPTSYPPQSAPSQQNYGHANQGNSQPFPQEAATNHSGYAQQQLYSKPPAYGMPSQGPPQSYAPYQNPSQQYPYPSGGPMQQQQPPYPYNSAPPANDAYSQPLAHPTPGPVYGQPGGQVGSTYGQPGGQTSYGQPGGQVAPVYGQPGGQVAPSYGQPGSQVAPGYGQAGGQVEPGYQVAPGGYGQPGYQVAPGGYGPSPSQPGYGEQQQPVPNSGTYGGYQQGSSDASYGTGPVPAAYGAPPPTSNQPSVVYEQPTPQYASAPVYANQVYGGQH